MTATGNEPIAQRQRRKRDHLHWALQLEETQLTGGLEDLRLVHQALPLFDFSDISTEFSWYGRQLQMPLLINAITGGLPEGETINAALGRVARECGVALAVGSQSLALQDNSLAQTFKVARDVNPDGVVWANVSAQTPVKSCQEAVAMLQADGLQLHLNSAQELQMREGDRQFQRLQDHIAEIVSRITVPVIVKEVGNGLSRETVIRLFGLGVRWVDTSGQGGTNFIAIERARLGLAKGTLVDWGLPTAISLLETLSLGLPVQVIASGGVRTSLEIACSLAVGARMVGMVGSVLQRLQQSGEAAVCSYLQELQTELRQIMLLVGAQRLTELERVPVVVTGYTQQWLAARGIDSGRYARR